MQRSEISATEIRNMSMSFISNTCSISLLRTNSSHNRSPVLCRASNPPRDGKSAVRQMKDAVQQALRSRISRIDLEMPVGMNLGVQKEDEGDVEMAKAVLNMFEGTGLTVKCLVCENKSLKLLQNWTGTKATIEQFDKASKVSSSKSNMGFGKKRMAKNDKCDVYVVVAPKSSDMKRIADLSLTFGMNRLILLVNARLDGVDWPEAEVKEAILDSFQRVFIYKIDPHPQWTGGVLFRKFPDDWLLLKRNTVGAVDRLLETEEQPSLDQISNAFREKAENPSSNIFDSLSGLFQRKS